jgi:two-component system sensor histidine kinase FlrB
MASTSDQAQPGDAAALAAAFETFNAVSLQLEDSYRTLEREAARLRRQLDASESERVAEARRHADLAARLTALLEALPGGVLLLDADGRVQQANAAAIALLGEPLLGETWPALVARAGCAHSRTRGELALADGRRVTVAQKPLGPGRVLLLTDVTETRKVEELVARHRRLAALGEMAANLAHQIRTPLAAGLLYATNAARAELPAGQRDGLLARSIACLHDLETLVGDMLQFARGATLPEGRFALGELLDGVEVALRPVLAPGQSLDVARSARRLRVAGNRETLAGALINLATNALTAAGATARVTIAARRAGLAAEILVSDDGPGIAPELRERIFDPFFTSRPDGTGLGLPVARSIARAHRGDVLLLDATAGATTFCLRLPLAAAGAGDALAAEAAA